LQGFVDQLGPMMRHMGQDARTSYDWGQDLVDRIHAEMAARIPVGAIPDWQGWRDTRILAARGTQSQGETTRPDA
jgi:L-gulonate 3-dehydrogenase